MISQWVSWSFYQSAALRGTRVVIGVQQWLQLSLKPFGSNHLSKLRLRFCFQPASSWSAFPADQSAWQLHSIHLAWPRSVKYLAGTWQVLDKYLAISCSVPIKYLANTWPSNVQLILQPLSPVVHIVPEPRLWYCNSYIKSFWSLSSDFIIERKIIVIVIIPIPSTNVQSPLTSQPTQPNPTQSNNPQAAKEEEGESKHHLVKANCAKSYSVCSCRDMGIVPEQTYCETCSYHRMPIILSFFVPISI